MEVTDFWDQDLLFADVVWEILKCYSYLLLSIHALKLNNKKTDGCKSISPGYDYCSNMCVCVKMTTFRLCLHFPLTQSSIFCNPRQSFSKQTISSEWTDILCCNLDHTWTIWQSIHTYTHTYIFTEKNSHTCIFFTIM